MIGMNGHQRPIYGVLTEPIKGDMEKDILNSRMPD